MKLRKTFILLSLILSVSHSCEKDDRNAISFEVSLVNDNNTPIESFEIGDSVTFLFYLTNNTSRDIWYSEPCTELYDFLKVHKLISDIEYSYIGKPGIPCAGVERQEQIKKNETGLVGSLPLTETWNWPNLDQGFYYVGDTFKINVNSEILYFTSRIYFEIN
jgi:hypothetical protein